MIDLKKVTLLVALLLIAASISRAEGSLFVKAAPSGPSVSTTSTVFVDIPDLSLSFFQYHPGNICIALSAECFASANARVFIRALVDGNPASPSDVILVVGDFRGTHSFNFAASLTGGQHTVTLQYCVDSGSEAFMGDRTIWIATAPDHINTVAAQSGPDVNTSSSSYADIPGMPTTIQIPESGNVFVTFTGEAETTSDKRMFLRALIDGQASQPSNAVFCAGPFYGTRSFTFCLPNLTAGTHDLHLQWQVDTGGTAYLGDRTMTIGFANPNHILAGQGTLASISAPSGPQVSTTSTTFTSIPDLGTTLYLPENSTLMVGVTAEAYTDGGKRMFVRALIDGQPLSPSDAVLNNSGFTGTWSMNFIQPHCTQGSHQVSLQWKVDGGGTAYLGDRTMAVIAFSAPCPDLSSGFGDLQPASGDRAILVICWDPQRPAHPAPAIAAVEGLVFGGAPSVRDYYSVNSHNRIFINNAGVKGWYAAAKPESYYWGPADPGDTNGDGWINPHVEKWAEAIYNADATFDFAAFDANGDNILAPGELAVLMVIPQNDPYGDVRVPLAREYPASQPLIVDGVTIPLIAEVYIGAPMNFPLVAHELGHSLFNLPDMYFPFFQPYAAGAYSLMDITYAQTHLDPLAKIRLGWIQPALVNTSGYISIDAVERTHIAYILHDPAHGSQEYFILENRQPNMAYDGDLPDAGLAVWHIIEDPAVYQNLSAPAGVLPADWASISPLDWGRRAVRMIRPVYGPPFDNRLALWDGSDLQTGYDLLSIDSTPGHATLTWADGTPSGFAIKEISPSGVHMTALIEIPGMPTEVAREAESAANRPDRFSLHQNYPNPFNSATTIGYEVARRGAVKLQIFNMLGQEVKRLADRVEEVGVKKIVWDGRNNAGEELGTGLYICRMTCSESILSRKILLVK